MAYAPQGAVIQAWARPEETLRKEAVRLELEAATQRGVNVMTLIRQLHRAGVFDNDRAEQINELRTIRNDVAHGASITSSGASQFVITTESPIRDIEAYADIIQLRRIFEMLHVDYTNPDQIRKNPRGSTQ